MPIGNSFLSAHHLARVSHPGGMIEGPEATHSSQTFSGSADISADPPELLGPLDVVYSSFRSRVEATASDVELIQGWPNAKFFEMGAATHLHEIEMPVILVPSKVQNTFRVRTAEVRFWLSWITYMFRTFDRARWTDPETGLEETYVAIVERASINVGNDRLRLSLAIRTNASMGWNLHQIGYATTSKVLGRPATSYDTFVRYRSYTDGIYPWDDNEGVGLHDHWGITSLSLEARTTSESIVHTPYNTFNNNLMGAWLIADQINAKMVNLGGQMEAFGPVSGRSVRTTNISTQLGRRFSIGTKYDDPFHDPFPTDTDAVITPSGNHPGGIRIQVGSKMMGLAPNAQVMFIIPTGTLVGDAEMKSSGDGTISISRRWSGTLTNTPR